MVQIMYINHRVKRDRGKKSNYDDSIHSTYIYIYTALYT